MTDLPWKGEAAVLAARILTFIDTSILGTPSESFEGLALDIHRYQTQRDGTLAALIERQVQTCDDIPYVPVDLFKHVPVGTIAPEHAPITFLTSGTSSDRRGAHRLNSTRLYDHGALTWARTMLPDLPTDTVSLLLDPDQHPESSLSHMVRLFSAPSGTASWHMSNAGIHKKEFAAALHNAQQPVFIGATAFAMSALLEDQSVTCTPPPESIVMITGGFKGRQTRLDHSALFKHTAAALAPAKLVTEYGMTELSSQLWGVPDQPFVAPPWMRVRACDPRDGSWLPPNTVGQLCFLDLCNLDSTLGIETHDLGSVCDDGSVRLHGRLFDAPARGCSLTAEEALRNQEST